MGMIANYQEVNEEMLDELMQCNDLFEKIEELQEAGGIEIYDMDKMWDALHFLLTGKSASKPIVDDLISEAIVGTEVFSEETDDYIAYILADRVCEIAQKLKEIEISTYLKKFDMKKFSRRNIYPNIWTDENEKEEIMAELADCFEGLSAFYNQMAEKKKAVIVSIY